MTSLVYVLDFLVSFTKFFTDA